MTEFSEDQNSQTKRTVAEIPVILLVDDNAINLQMLHQTLTGQNYKLLSARSG
jgi:response regulator RpfG family c-di-GMP phosphodiesterase